MEPSVDTFKQELSQGMLNIYASEGCGICEKEGADVIWYSPKGHGAHARCVKEIRSTESYVNRCIEAVFEKTKDGYRYHNEAHSQTFAAIKASCGNDSILEYANKNGKEALKQLFRTVGKEALRTYTVEILTEIKMEPYHDEIRKDLKNQGFLK